MSGGLWFEAHLDLLKIAMGTLYGVSGFRAPSIGVFVTAYQLQEDLRHGCYAL